MSCHWLPECFGGTVSSGGQCQRSGRAVWSRGQCSLSHSRLLQHPWPGQCWAVAGALALAAPSLAMPCWLLVQEGFSLCSVMTQPDTGWQEPWWMYRGTVSPDRGTVCLLWSGAALTACAAEAWLLNQTHFLIAASFSSFLLPLSLDTWVHS